MITSIEFQNLVTALDLSKNIVYDDLKYSTEKFTNNDIDINLYETFINFLESVAFDCIDTNSKHLTLYVTYSKNNKKFGSLTLAIVLKLFYDIKEITEQFTIDFFTSNSLKHEFFSLYKDIKEFTRLLTVIIIKITIILKRTTIYN